MKNLRLVTAAVITLGAAAPAAAADLPQKVVTMRLGPRSAAKLAIAGRTPTGFSV